MSTTCVPCSLQSSSIVRRAPSFSFFFFNDTATTEIYTLSLHDALPIYRRRRDRRLRDGPLRQRSAGLKGDARPDRKSTRLNSSHSQISYAVFCLKKKKKRQKSNRVRKQSI